MPLNRTEIGVKKDGVLDLTKRLTLRQHEMDLLLDIAFANIQPANENVRKEVLGKQKEIMSIVYEIDSLNKQKVVLVFIFFPAPMQNHEFGAVRTTCLWIALAPLPGLGVG